MKNMYGFLCKLRYLAKINLEKNVFKAENETIQHEWSLVTFKTVSKNWKYPVVEEGESASRNKLRSSFRRAVPFVEHLQS